MRSLCSRISETEATAHRLQEELSTILRGLAGKPRIDGFLGGAPQALLGGEENLVIFRGISLEIGMGTAKYSSSDWTKSTRQAESEWSFGFP